MQYGRMIRYHGSKACSMIRKTKRRRFLYVLSVLFEHLCQLTDSLKAVTSDCQDMRDLCGKNGRNEDCA